MDRLTFRCPLCSQTFPAPPSLIGAENAACPKCGRLVSVWSRAHVVGEPSREPDPGPERPRPRRRPSRESYERADSRTARQMELMALVASPFLGVVIALLVVLTNDWAMLGAAIVGSAICGTLWTVWLIVFITRGAGDPRRDD